jgi:hypothetical protein
MIEYLAYGVLLAIGFHLGGKISKKLNLSPKNEKKTRMLKGTGLKTKTFMSKLGGGAF